MNVGVGDSPRQIRLFFTPRGGVACRGLPGPWAAGSQGEGRIYYYRGGVDGLFYRVRMIVINEECNSDRRSQFMLLQIGPMCMFFLPVARRPVVAPDNDRVSGDYGINLVCSCLCPR